MLDNNFYTISQYVGCKTTKLERIAAIEALIDALLLKTLDAVDGATYDEYQLDDGQMKVRTKYRSVQDVQKGIVELEKLKQMYIRRVNGRIAVLKSGNLNFRNRGCF